MNNKKGAYSPENLENDLKRYSLWGGLIAYFFVLSLLSYFQIDNDHSWSENFFKNISEVIDHAISFAVLVLVFGILFRKHIVEAIEGGFSIIGTVVAEKMEEVSQAAKDFRSRLDDLMPAQEPTQYKNGEESSLSSMTRRVQKAIDNTKKLAVKHAEQGDFDKVKETWRELINMHPKVIFIVEEILNFYEENRNLSTHKQDALALIQSVEDKFTKNSDYYRTLAVAYVKIGVRDNATYDQAVSAAEKSLELDENNIKSYRSLGYIHYWFNNIDEAIKITEKAHEKIRVSTPEIIVASVKNNLAFYYALNKVNKNEALRYVEESLDLFKKNKDIDGQALAFDTLGFVQWMFELKSLKEARENFQKAAELNPKESLFYQHLQEIDLKIKRIFS